MTWTIGLQPHVRIWNSVSLHTLHVIGLGDFEKSIACLAFSKAVNIFHHENDRWNQSAKQKKSGPSCCLVRPCPYQANLRGSPSLNQVEKMGKRDPSLLNSQVENQCNPVKHGKTQ